MFKFVKFLPYVIVLPMVIACNNSEKRPLYPIHSLPIVFKKNHSDYELKIPKISIKSDTLSVSGSTVVFFEPSQNEFDAMVKADGEDSGLNEIISDFDVHSTKVVDSLHKTSKLKAVVTSKKIITVALNNGKKISFDRTKGNNIVGAIYTNGIKNPKIDFEVGTDEDCWVDINEFFGK